MIFQQTQVAQTGTNYPYKAYIDTIPKTKLRTLQNLLTSQLFYKENGPDTNDARMQTNRGLYLLHLSTVGGKRVDLQGPLFVDLFEQYRLLVNGVIMGIKLWSILDAFRLILDSSTPNQKVNIVNVCLKLCVQWRDICDSRETTSQTAALCPYLRSEMKTILITPG